MSNEPTNPDDFDLFRQAIKGARQITVDQADTGKPRADSARIKAARQLAVRPDNRLRVDGLSDQFVIDVMPEEELAWTANGVQESQLRKLKSGQIPFEGSIDLHGMTVDKARELLWEFLAEANTIEIQRKDGRNPILKSHVNTWLRQHTKVLGFTSCIPRHGGTGSVYVLLKRTMLEGRDE
jgi:DNA-nicking Smr family endonuclease